MILHKTNLRSTYRLGDSGLIVRRRREGTWLVAPFKTTEQFYGWWEEHRPEMHTLSFPTRKAAVEYAQACLAVHPPGVDPPPRGTIVRTPSGQIFVRTPRGRAIRLERTPCGWIVADTEQARGFRFVTLRCACEWAARYERPHGAAS